MLHASYSWRVTRSNKYDQTILMDILTTVKVKMRFWTFCNNKLFLWTRWIWPLWNSQINCCTLWRRLLFGRSDMFGPGETPRTRPRPHQASQNSIRGQQRDLLDSIFCRRVSIVIHNHTASCLLYYFFLANANPIFGPHFTQAEQRMECSVCITLLLIITNSITGALVYNVEAMTAMEKPTDKYKQNYTRLDIVTIVVAEKYNW